MTALIADYKNGNASIKLYDDGTRIIESDASELKLAYPLNIDIRISEACAFGKNPKTGKAVCDFCHESATTDGANANLKELGWMLTELPPGIELAVGVNHFTEDVLRFFGVMTSYGYIINATVNQGLIRRDSGVIQRALDEHLIQGLGVSYRQGMIFPPEFILEYSNTVMHVIAGIDDIDEVKKLAERGVKKILVLGEKDFGFNLGKIKVRSHSHFKWYRQVHELFKLFDVVSFDNLALEQLNVKRFVIDWDTTYQHEYSFYINAVQKYFAPSSRSSDVVFYNEDSSKTPIKDYFQSIFPEFQL